MLVASVDELRVQCPPWCAADHDREAPGGWLPPNGDAVLHASAPFLEISEPGNLPDILRVTVIEPQVHPDRDQAGGTEILVEGSLALSRRADTDRLIAALHAAQSLLPR